MKAIIKSHREKGLVMATIRRRITQGGERVWRYEDFANLPFTAVAQALSRLTRSGVLERLSKGVYYRPRTTTFGQSRPNPFALQRLAARQRIIFPSGLAAANLLGFTTQSPARSEVATAAGSLPRKLLGPDTVIHSRRPAAWTKLSVEEGAFLDFLRKGGRFSELSPHETLRRTLAWLAEGERWNHLMRVSYSEPPRVRALLGALGEHMGQKPQALHTLRRSLNPLSKFDFGVFTVLPQARAWKAKGSNDHETP